MRNLKHYFLLALIISTNIFAMDNPAPLLNGEQPESVPTPLFPSRLSGSEILKMYGRQKISYNGHELQVNPTRRSFEPSDNDYGVLRRHQDFTKTHGVISAFYDFFKESGEEINKAFIVHIVVNKN